MKPENIVKCKKMSRDYHFKFTIMDLLKFYSLSVETFENPNKVYSKILVVDNQVPLRNYGCSNIKT